VSRYLAARHDLPLYSSCHLRIFILYLASYSLRMALTLGTILYVAILLINAMAVLSEDRFLARIGWSSVPPPTVTAGFSQSYASAYDQAGYAAQQDVGMKARLITLISAVRTLMRIPLIGVNLIIIIYELILGH